MHQKKVELEGVACLAGDESLLSKHQKADVAGRNDRKVEKLHPLLDHLEVKCALNVALKVTQTMMDVCL